MLLKCLKASGFFEGSKEPPRDDIEKEGRLLTPNELYIGALLFHFQTGIQYNLHAVYQVFIIAIFGEISSNILCTYYVNQCKYFMHILRREQFEFL